MEYVTNEYIEENFLRRKIDDERITKITARMVLSHSCGFPNWRSGGHLKIFFEPGEKYSYSGEGFGFLFLVIEEITGLSLQDFMRKEVFAPLHMNNSSYVWEEKYDELTSFPHDMMMEAKQKRKPSLGHAAASLHTTASDFAKYIMALMNNTGLQKSTIDSMLTPQVVSNPELTQDVFWGLGIGLQKTPDGMSCWHWGDNGDFKCLFLAVPNKKIGVVYFANSANGLMIRKKLVDLAIGGDHSLFNDDYLSGYGDPDEPGMVFIKKLATENLESAIDFYNEKRKTMEPVEIVSENKMNQLGYYFLRKKQFQVAIQILKINVESFPESSNVYDSLGEAYMNNGDTELAIINYEKSLKLNPDNMGAIDNLKKLREK